MMGRDGDARSAVTEPQSDESMDSVLAFVGGMSAIFTVVGAALFWGGAGAILGIGVWLTIAAGFAGIELAIEKIATTRRQ